MIDTINALLLAFAALAVILPGIALAVASSLQWVPGDNPLAFARARDAAEARWREVLAPLDTGAEYAAGIPLDSAEGADALAGALAWPMPREGECWLEVCAETYADCRPILPPSAPARLRLLPPVCRGPLLALPPPLARGKARVRDSRGRFARAA